MRAASDTADDRQLDLPVPVGPLSVAEARTQERLGRKGARDRVTVDLRGLGQPLRSCARDQRTTPAALLRKAVLQMLDTVPVPSGGQQLEPSAARGLVKVTLRISRAHARSLADRARAADVAQGDYVCGLLDVTPPAPPASDHAASVATLMASTDRLAAMSSDLNAFLRLLGRVQAAELESYRAGLKSLTTDVREHLACAAALIAELRPARRPQR